MLVFYTMNVYTPSGTYRTLAVVSGVVEAITVFLFFFNMLMTLLTKVEQPK
jgi:hypothetical protein